MKEIFKPIKEFEGIYEISNLGRVKSLPKKVHRGNHYILTKEKILKHGKNNRGYHKVELYKDSNKKTMFIHKLVAEHFIPNDDSDKNQINHINGNKDDNTVSNLEWVNQSENMCHSYKIGLRQKPKITSEQKEKMRLGRIKSKEFNKSKRKIVQQIDIHTGKIVCEYESVAKAARIMNCDPSTISDVAGGKKNRKTAKGYIWKYKN